MSGKRAARKIQKNRPSLESTTIRAARAELFKRIRAVGVERDKLREMASDYEDLANSCDEAMDGLQAAIEALSKYA